MNSISKPEGGERLEMESTKPNMYQLENNESLKDQTWVNLQQGPYTWLNEEKKRTINTTAMLEHMNDSSCWT